MSDIRWLTSGRTSGCKKKFATETSQRKWAWWSPDCLCQKMGEPSCTGRPNPVSMKDLDLTRGVDPKGLGTWPLWKYVGGVRVCFDPLKCYVTFFHSKLLLDNSASFTSSRMKNLCQKWKVKLIFRGAYKQSGTGMWSAWKSLTQRVIWKSDGLTWLTLTPILYDRWHILALPLDMTHHREHVVDGTESDLERIFSAVWKESRARFFWQCCRDGTVDVGNEILVSEDDWQSRSP